MKIQAENWIPLSQTLLLLVIACFSGWWSYTTYSYETNRELARERDQRERKEAEAIASMSKQLGLMAAQCDDVALRDIGDGFHISPRRRGCYEAYIGARSLIYLSRIYIFPSGRTESTIWNEKWKQFAEQLQSAGTTKYNRNALEKRWDDIVKDSLAYNGYKSAQNDREDSYWGLKCAICSSAEKSF